MVAPTVTTYGLEAGKLGLYPLFRPHKQLVEPSEFKAVIHSIHINAVEFILFPLTFIGRSIVTCCDYYGDSPLMKYHINIPHIDGGIEYPYTTSINYINTL